jgi:arginase
MRRIAVLDAPSNLGLRPPTETSVPGCAKAPGALRDHGLLDRLGARDAGCLTPPRYDPGDWRPGDGVCHAVSIAAYSKQLADRIGAIIDAGEFPVVLGGDCSIVLGSALAMNRLGEDVGGRIGLVFVDGHSDFRHPGNASYVGAAAGEDLALVTGRGQPDLAAIEGRRPYFRDIDVVVLGIRGHDEYRLDLQAAGIVTRAVPALRAEGAARTAQWARDQLVDCAGYWVHVDVDVLDPAVMPAVDAPEPGGIAFPELELLLAGLVDTPHCLGVEITVFDPDYDTDGAFAEEITAAVVSGLAPVRAVDPPAALRTVPAQAPARSPSAPALTPSPAGDFVVGASAATRDAGAPVHKSLPDFGPPAQVRPVSPWPSSASVPAFAVPPIGGSGRRREPDLDVLDDPTDFDDDHVESDYFGHSQASVLDRVVADAAASVAAPDADDDHADPAQRAVGAPEPAESAAAPDADEPDGPDRVEVAAEQQLGVRPLLESDHLPASAPGKLRPRPVDAFTLPVQRPAFDAGDVTSADHA